MASKLPRYLSLAISKRCECCSAVGDITALGRHADVQLISSRLGNTTPKTSSRKLLALCCPKSPRSNAAWTGYLTSAVPPHEWHRSNRLGTFGHAGQHAGAKA